MQWGGGACVILGEKCFFVRESNSVVQNLKTLKPIGSPGPVSAPGIFGSKTLCFLGPTLFSPQSIECFILMLDPNLIQFLQWQIITIARITNHHVMVHYQTLDPSDTKYKLLKAYNDTSPL